MEDDGAPRADTFEVVEPVTPAQNEQEEQQQQQQEHEPEAGEVASTMADGIALDNVSAAAPAEQAVVEELSAAAVDIQQAPVVSALTAPQQETETIGEAEADEKQEEIIAEAETVAEAEAETITEGSEHATTSVAAMEVEGLTNETNEADRAELHALIDQVAATNDAAALVTALEAGSTKDIISALKQASLGSRDAVHTSRDAVMPTTRTEASEGAADDAAERQADAADAVAYAHMKEERAAAWDVMHDEAGDVDAEHAQNHQREETRGGSVPQAEDEPLLMTQQQRQTANDVAQRHLVDETVEEVTREAETTVDALETLPGDHPLMQRVQAALYAQLKEANDRLDLELREKEEAATRAKNEHQATGVRLYDYQAGLSQLQSKMSATQKSFSVIKQLRDEADQKKEAMGQEWKRAHEQLKEAQRRVIAQRLELDDLNKKLNLMLSNSESLDSDISVAKRAALNMEQQLQASEKQKRRQDHYIDSLQQQVMGLEEQDRLYQQQFQVQQKETVQAKHLLREAETEMDMVKMEKRALTQQWRRSLAHLQRKEAIIRTLQDDIKTQRHTIMLTGNEMTGVQRSIRRAEEDGQTIQSLYDRATLQTESVQAQLAALQTQRDKLAQTSALVEKSLERTEADLKQHEREAKAMRGTIKGFEHEIRKVVRDIRSIEEAHSDQMMSQMLVSQSNKGILKDGNVLRQSIEEKEAQLAQTENTIAQKRLEILQWSADLAVQRRAMALMDNDMNDKNKAIEQYEVDAHKRNIELTKKQSEVDELNKRLNVLNSRETDESLGPLEATIHNMNKTITQKEAESIQVQQFWLKAQTELVTLLRKADETSNDLEELRMREQVWSRKRILLNAQFDREQKAIKSLQRDVRGLHQEQVRINTLASKHNSQQRQLEENNKELESEFRAKLRLAELESIRLEESITALFEEKEQALAGIVDAERQIMLWEKKIQLAKETQAALDPTTGATEHRMMAAEISRMTFRLSQMQKIQEQLITDMEKAVWRRDGIAKKNKVALGYGAETSRTKGHQTEVLKRDITELTNKLKKLLNEIHEADEDAKAMVNAREQMVPQVQAARDLITRLVETHLTLMRHYKTLNQDRLVSLQATQLTFARYKYYTALGAGQYKFACGEASRRGELLSKWQAKNAALVETVTGFYNEQAQEAQRQDVVDYCEGSGLYGLLKAAPTLDVLIR